MKGMFIMENKKDGFTLVELLITLAIIGVVAVITLPAIYNKIQKDITVNRLKKVYSEFQQAIRLSQAENGDMSSWNADQKCSAFFEEYIGKYMPLSGKKSLSKNGANGITYKTISGQTEIGLAILRNDGNFRGNYNYFTKNGTQIFVSNYTYQTCRFKFDILIDINGYNKPNQFGKDVFIFGFDIRYPEHGVYLSGMYSTGEYSFPVEPNLNRNYLKNGKYGINGMNYRYECNKKADSRGMWCGALIYADGWKISKDYPW